MVESLKFMPPESGSAEAVLEVIGPDVLSAFCITKMLLRSKLGRLDFCVAASKLACCEFGENYFKGMNVGGE